MMRDGRTTNGGQRRKDRCHRGHDYSDAYVRAADGQRVCRGCAIDRAVRQYQRRKAA